MCHTVASIKMCILVGQSEVATTIPAFSLD
jgi:hypothetical protein